MRIGLGIAILVLLMVVGTYWWQGSSSDRYCPNRRDALEVDFTDKASGTIKQAVRTHQKTAYEVPIEIAKRVVPSVTVVDLNKDGRQDFISSIAGQYWCGTAGCVIEVYIQQPDNSFDAQYLFHGGPKQKLWVLDEAVNSYRQILANDIHSREGNAYHIWQWDGEKYVYASHCISDELPL